MLYNINLIVSMRVEAPSREIATDAAKEWLNGILEQAVQPEGVNVQMPATTLAEHLPIIEQEAIESVERLLQLVDERGEKLPESARRNFEKVLRSKSSVHKPTDV